MNLKANIEISTEAGDDITYNAVFENVTPEFRAMMESEDAGYELTEFIQDDAQFERAMESYGVEIGYSVMRIIFEGEPNFIAFDDGDHLTIDLA